MPSDLSAAVQHAMRVHSNVVMHCSCGSCSSYVLHACRAHTISLCSQVCECVVILKNLKEVNWAGAKSMMADTGFLKGLVEFDKDSLSEKQVMARPQLLLLSSASLQAIKPMHTAHALCIHWLQSLHSERQHPHPACYTVCVVCHCLVVRSSQCCEHASAGKESQGVYEGPQVHCG